MLDHDRQKTELAEWILALPCNVRLPAAFSSDKVERGASLFGDVRQFPRLICRGERYRAALEHRQSLPALPRPTAWHGVPTIDVSRGGCGFLHGEPLYPGERMRLVLLTGAQHTVEVVWCRRMGEECFAIGAKFIEAAAASS